MNIMNIMNEVTKTKKNRKENNKQLWNLFDTEINYTKTNIECIYRQNGEREICELCESILKFCDEGFLVCQNEKCGIIYKDIIDQTAEWRYYGADDTAN